MTKETETFQKPALHLSTLVTVLLGAAFGVLAAHLTLPMVQAHSSILEFTYYFAQSITGSLFSFLLVKLLSSYSHKESSQLKSEHNQLYSWNYLIVFIVCGSCMIGVEVVTLSDLPRIDPNITPIPIVWMVTAIELSIVIGVTMILFTQHIATFTQQLSTTIKPVIQGKSDSNQNKDSIPSQVYKPGPHGEILKELEKWETETYGVKSSIDPGNNKNSENTDPW